MGRLLALSESHVRSLLLSLRREHVEHIATRLGNALRDLSVGDASCAGSAAHQVERSVRHRASGDTNVFMPALSSSAFGSKLLVIPATASAAGSDATGAPRRTAPRGAMLLMRPAGDPVAVIAAEELTGFRTALGALLLLPRRRAVGDILVFGAGMQALWHVRLALLLRGPDVRSVTVVGRSPARTAALLRELRRDYHDPDAGGDDNHHHQPHQPSPGLQLRAGAEGLHAGTPEHAAEVARLVRAADVVFCTTPATAPLFPAAHVRGSSYVTAIGSYEPHMLELDPGLLKRSIAAGGPVLVDARDAVAAGAGEVVRGGIAADELLELGELFDAEGKGTPDAARETWLQEGLVVYKGVGCGVMDVSVAEVLVDLAEEMGIGVAVDGF